MMKSSTMKLGSMAGLARRLLRPAPSRQLNAWAGAFDENSGAPLAARMELASKLEGVWQVKMEEQDSSGLAAAAGSSSSAIIFKLQVEGTPVAVMRAALLPPPPGTDTPATGLLIGAQAHPALPLRAAGVPLIDASRKYLAKRGAGRVMAVAPLPGFCQWIVSEAAWHALDDKDPGYSDDQPSAVEAVAKGVPREGHSVLGHGTFTAAQPALEKLAFVYASRLALDTEAETECAMFAAAGAEVVGVNYMHATDADSMRDSAGTTVSMHFNDAVVEKAEPKAEPETITITTTKAPPKS